MEAGQMDDYDDDDEYRSPMPAIIWVCTAYVVIGLLVLLGWLVWELAGG